MPSVNSGTQGKKSHRPKTLSSIGLRCMRALQAGMTNRLSREPRRVLAEFPLSTAKMPASAALTVSPICAFFGRLHSSFRLRRKATGGCPGPSRPRSMRQKEQHLVATQARRGLEWGMKATCQPVRPLVVLPPQASALGPGRGGLPG